MRVIFRVPPGLSAEESWHERPVRRRRGAIPPLAYLTNSTSPHGINIVHLILRDHGFARLRSAEGGEGNVVTAGGGDTGGAPSTTTITGNGDGPGAAWSLFWCGGPLDVRIVHALLPFQKVSKFPNARCLTLKQHLWRHFKHMRGTHGAEHFDYMPQTFTLPDELEVWRDHARAVRRSNGAEGGDDSDCWWIVKPNNASRSRGIFLTRSCGGDENAEVAGVCGVVCRYLPPLLVDGAKFDLRLYCLVTSWHPLVVYLYDDGLARFATKQYTLNTKHRDDVAVHLTNATCNPTARRMLLPALKARLACDVGAAAADGLWSSVDELVVKTMLSVEGTMDASLSACSLPVATGRPNTHCFQLYGLDVMIDHALKPWLLEVNLDPSLQTADLPETPPNANAHLKASLVADLLNTVGVLAPPPLPDGSRASSLVDADAERMRKRTPEEARAAALRHVDAEMERAKQGGWRRLLPAAGRSAACARFIGEARRDLNALPFAS